MAEHVHGPNPAPTATGRNRTKSLQQTDTSVSDAAYQEVASTVDCATFLSKSRSFSSAIVTLQVHPCFRKEGEEYKTLTIGCRSQGSDGVKIEPKFTLKDVETQCPGGNEKRREKSEIMVTVDVNELGLADDKLLSLLWDLGTPEDVMIDGTAYTRQAIGLPSGELQRFVMTIRPINRDGQPVPYFFTFPNVQIVSEGFAMTLSQGSDNKGELMFNVLYDGQAGTVGWINTLK